MPERENPGSQSTVILITGIVLLVLLLLLLLVLLTRSNNEPTGGGAQESGTAAAGAGTPSSESGGGEKADRLPESKNEDAGTEPPETVTENSTTSENTTVPDTGTDPQSPSAEMGEAQTQAMPETDSPRTVGIGNVSGTAEFFGVAGTTGPVSYVIDRSGSMAGGKFDLAREQFLESMNKLGEAHSFNAFFYDATFDSLEGGTLAAATDDRKAAYEQLASGIIPGGGTDPVPSIAKAVDSGTTCIFLLSDGEFVPGAAEAIIALCRDRDIIVHTFSMQYDSQTLRRIATECGGAYKLIQ